MADSHPSVEYFEHEGRTYAFVGVWGSHGMFLLEDCAASWTFHPVNSLRYDSAHQETYRNHRTSAVSEARRARLPALPPLPDETSISWGDSFRLTRRGLLSSEALVRWVNSAPGGEATVYYVLNEDGYESAFGDGVFRYFEDAFLTESDAAAFLEEKKKQAKSEWERYHLRALKLRSAGRALELEFSPQVFDHAKADEILETAARKAGTNPPPPASRGSDAGGR